MKSSIAGGLGSGDSEEPKLGRVFSAGLSRYPDHPATNIGEKKALGPWEQTTGQQGSLQFCKQRPDKGLVSISTLHFVPLLDLKSLTQMEYLITHEL